MTIQNLARTVALLAAVLLSFAPCRAADAPAPAPAATPAPPAPALLKDGQRIIFMGDSITDAGKYVRDIEGYLLTHLPKTRLDIINMGLSSETVTGLTEAGHPFPRPNMIDRLDATLAKAKPDVLIVCYGMNDGIYAPLDEQRTKAFREGIETVIAKCRAASVTPVIVTPPLFDRLPIEGKLSKGADIVYGKPFADYDKVLQAYSAWELTLRDKGITVIDIHTPMMQFVAEQRKTNPTYTFGRDGIHPNAAGHAVMAEAILRGLGAPGDGKLAELPKELEQKIGARHGILHKAWLSHVGHKRPGIGPGLPIEEATAKAAAIDAEIRELLNKPAPASK